MNETPRTLDDATLAKLAGLATALQEQVSHALLGQDEVLQQMLCALLAGGHVLIEGVPGLGKTLMVRALAGAIGCNFGRIQFTPDLMPSDVTGHAVYDAKTGNFNLRRGPIFTNLLLADEINRAPAKTQAALLEVMQEGQVTIEGSSQPLPPPFMAIATQNPVEHEGTYPLPEAQLDRFLFKIRMGYPSAADETRMVAAVTTGRAANAFNLDGVKRSLSAEQVVAAQTLVANVPVDEVVADYAVRIAQATRSWPGVMLGAGPRGSIALVRAARAFAVLGGRDFVTPDDIRGVALPALRHRIILAPELQIEGQQADDVLRQLLDKVEAPRK
ncbi:MAG TPA: MoxR family ATPase [Gammaproteobacteria bacterium]|jgi:MoxR-like ATPase